MPDPVSSQERLDAVIVGEAQDLSLALGEALFACTREADAAYALLDDGRTSTSAGRRNGGPSQGTIVPCI